MAFALPARLRIAMAVLGLSVLATSCGGSDPATKAAEARSIDALDAAGVPGTLKGLQVKREDIEPTLDLAERPYLDGIALFSMREADKLEATLQIGRFAEDSKYTDPDFRLTLLNTVGGGAPKRLRMGDREVYLTTGDRQSLAIWFEDRYLFILSSREDYDFPRGLLREALEVKP